MSYLEHLEKVECAPLFSLNGHKTKAKVIKVYDGDSITVIFDYCGKYFSWKCRLIGIDTPEIRGSSEPEKKLAIKARDYLRSLILHKVVDLECFKFDKYGRLLVDVRTDDTVGTVNELMISKDYAKPYDGGTKQKWGK